MSNTAIPIQCTAGAIPFKNEKGEISMKKVKVSRYVAGKAPEFYNHDDFEIEDDFHDESDIKDIHYKIAFPDRALLNIKKEDNDEMEEENENDEGLDDDIDDPRIRRLYYNKSMKSSGHIEMLGDDSESEDEEDKISRHIRERQADLQLDTTIEGTKSDIEEEEEDEEEIALRRKLARERALANEMDTEIPEVIDDNEVEDFIEYSDEYESESDNEKEPKLKPVYVKPSARLTINKTKDEIIKEQDREKNKFKRQEEQKQITKKMIEEVNKQEIEESRTIDEACDAINSDIENETEEYEAWKLRELKRIKRDRQEKEQCRRDKEEILRIRNMTEEQRVHEFKANPKIITNQQIKGQLKFMQKYYHRGAYYIQEEEESVFKRDFTQPTLEDNFTITNLPLIKQVKNFGKAGRTKYTHLVDQDTTDYESGWASTSQVMKFYNNKGGGMKQVFDKPSHKKK